MSQSDGKTDGQRGDEARVWFVLVSHSEDDQNEHEAEEELKSKSLELVDTFSQICVTQAQRTVSKNISD